MKDVYKQSIAEVKRDEPFSELEERLLACCETGEMAVLPGLDDLPDEDDKDPSRRVRAGLIRYLLLGGCKKGRRPHPKGVELQGAVVTGVLDLEGCTTDRALFLGGCRLTDTPVFRDARLPFFGLPGCQVPGIDAQRLRVDRVVLLKERFTSTGHVDLIGAQIGGTLDCTNGRFAEGLNGDAMTVRASVFLRGGFAAEGPVILRGASIGGQLDCTDGRFVKDLNGDALTVGTDIFLRDGFAAEGPVNLRGASIGGQLACSNGRFAMGLDGDAMTVGADIFLWGDKAEVAGTLDLRRARVTGNLQIEGASLTGKVLAQWLTVGNTLKFRDIRGGIPLLDLEDARLGKLDDDTGSWDKVETYYLGDLRYDATGPHIGLRDRLRWLDRNTTVPDKDRHGKDRPTFDPQPYSQLASVLTQNGHRNAAARVLYEREKKLRANERLRRDGIRGGFRGVLAAPFDWTLFRPAEWLFGKLFGYGYLPARAVYTAVVLWILAVGLYGTAFDRFQMAPTAPVVLVSQDWEDAVKAENACPTSGGGYPPRTLNDGCTMPLDIWLAEAEAAPDYASFNRWLYGVDAIVPLVSFGQQSAWAASRDRGRLGWWGFHLAWVFQAAGGVIAAFGAALLTGAVGRKD